MEAPGAPLRPPLFFFAGTAGFGRELAGLVDLDRLGGLVTKAVSPERIILSFQHGSFYGRQAESPDSIAAIKRVAQQHLGSAPEVQIRFDAPGDDPTNTVAAVAAQRKEAEVDAKRREALNHPRVRDALDVFPEAEGKLSVHVEAD